MSKPFSPASIASDAQINQSDLSQQAVAAGAWHNAAYAPTDVASMTAPGTQPGAQTPTDSTALQPLPNPASGTPERFTQPFPQPGDQSAQNQAQAASPALKEFMAMPEDREAEVIAELAVSSKDPKAYLKQVMPSAAVTQIEVQLAAYKQITAPELALALNGLPPVDLQAAAVAASPADLTSAVSKARSLPSLTTGTDGGGGLPVVPVGFAGAAGLAGYVAGRVHAARRYAPTERTQQPPPPEGVNLTAAQVMERRPQLFADMHAAAARKLADVFGDVPEVAPGAAAFSDGASLRSSSVSSPQQWQRVYSDNSVLSRDGSNILFEHPDGWILSGELVAGSDPWSEVVDPSSISAKTNSGIVFRAGRIVAGGGEQAASLLPMAEKLGVTLE